MVNNYTSGFKVSFLGFEKMQQAQLDDLVSQHVAYLDGIEIKKEHGFDEVVDIYVINYCEGAEAVLPLEKDGRIICAGKFHNFENILSLVHKGYFGCISCTAIFSEVIPAIAATLQKKVYISPAFNSVIHGYFQKNVVKTASGCLFTEQEHKLVQHLTAGALYKEIAHELKISENTVRSHVRNIYSKLKVHSKTELAQKILKGNLITTLTCFLPDFIACLCY
jgi:DNA-binding NarL/FixJ family response regulator